MTVFDPLVLETFWSRLISTVDQQAAALIRTSFTPSVAECGDLSACVFDPRGFMLAQAVTGTPESTPQAITPRWLTEAKLYPFFNRTAQVLESLGPRARTYIHNRQTTTAVPAAAPAAVPDATVPASAPTRTTPPAAPKK